MPPVPRASSRSRLTLSCAERRRRPVTWEACSSTSVELPGCEELARAKDDDVTMERWLLSS